jgi:hypothetical protein
MPSSFENHRWVLSRRALAAQVRAPGAFVHYKSVLRLLAPDRSSGNGWRLVVSRVFGDEDRAGSRDGGPQFRPTTPSR